MSKSSIAYQIGFGKQIKELWKYRWQYSMIIPALVLLFLFSYMPMVGLQIAFKDFQLGSTIANSPWVGFSNFDFLRNQEFWNVVRNTLTITLLKFAFGFFAPIILALLLNEIKSEGYKRVIQSVSYIPHFVSWIVVAYVLESFLSPSVGIVNQVLNMLGQPSIYFMGDVSWFRPMIVISSLWKETGWGTIIYLAAIASLDVQLYEAAYVEGAGKWAQFRFITLPGLVPTIILMLILTLPSLISAGYDQIYPLINPANMQVSDVIDTYIIRNGLQQGYFSMAAPVGILSSVISLILMLSANAISKKATGNGLW